jgi:hypothetical protein
MKTPLKYLRIYETHVLAKAYPLTLCLAQSNLMRQLFKATVLSDYNCSNFVSLEKVGYVHKLLFVHIFYFLSSILDGLFKFSFLISRVLFE